jgi:hypothetical protein
MSSSASAVTSAAAAVVNNPSVQKPAVPHEATRLKIKHCCKWFFGYGFLWVLTGTLSSVFDMAVIDRNWDNGALRWVAALGFSVAGGIIGSFLNCYFEGKQISSCCAKNKDVEITETACLKFVSCITRVSRCAFKLFVTKSCILGGFLSAFGDNVVEKDWNGLIVPEIIGGIVCGGFITWVAELCEHNFCPNCENHAQEEPASFDVEIPMTDLTQAKTSPKNT